MPNRGGRRRRSQKSTTLGLGCEVREIAEDRAIFRTRVGQEVELEITPPVEPTPAVDQEVLPEEIEERHIYLRMNDTPPPVSETMTRAFEGHLRAIFGQTPGINNVENVVSESIDDTIVAISPQIVPISVGESHIPNGRGARIGRRENRRRREAARRNRGAREMPNEPDDGTRPATTDVDPITYLKNRKMVLPLSRMDQMYGPMMKDMGDFRHTLIRMSFVHYTWIMCKPIMEMDIDDRPILSLEAFVTFVQEMALHICPITTVEASLPVQLIDAKYNDDNWGKLDELLEKTPDLNPRDLDMETVSAYAKDFLLVAFTVLVYHRGPGGGFKLFDERLITRNLLDTVKRDGLRLYVRIHDILFTFYRKGSRS